MGAGLLPIIDFGLPFRSTAQSYDRLDELLHACRPVPDPLGLTTYCKRTTGSFPLERADLIGTYTFREPDGSRSRNSLCQAMV